MKPLETTIPEVLRDAIQSEMETRAYFQQMAGRTRIPEVRKRMLELADLELLHRARLERRYRELLHEPPPDPKPVSIELPPEIDDLDMRRAMKLALERERDAESQYRFLAERVPATTELGKLFVELAETEWKHKTELQAEYDATTDDPEQFLLDM